MSNRYFVRTVNHNTIQEHFVVADFRQEGACVNVYYNRPAALDEARRLNRHYHQQQLDRLHELQQLDSLTSPSIAKALSQAEAIGDGQHLVSAPDSRRRPGRLEASTASKPTSHPEKTSKQVAEDLMRRRLVR